MRTDFSLYNNGMMVFLCVEQGCFILLRHHIRKVDERRGAKELGVLFSCYWVAINIRVDYTAPFLLADMNKYTRFGTPEDNKYVWYGKKNGKSNRRRLPCNVLKLQVNCIENDGEQNDWLPFNGGILWAENQQTDRFETVKQTNEQLLSEQTAKMNWVCTHD